MSQPWPSVNSLRQHPGRGPACQQVKRDQRDSLPSGPQMDGTKSADAGPTLTAGQPHINSARWRLARAALRCALPLPATGSNQVKTQRSRSRVGREVTNTERGEQCRGGDGRSISRAFYGAPPAGDDRADTDSRAWPRSRGPTDSARLADSGLYCVNGGMRLRCIVLSVACQPSKFRL